VYHATGLLHGDAMNFTNACTNVILINECAFFVCAELRSTCSSHCASKKPAYLQKSCEYQCRARKTAQLRRVVDKLANQHHRHHHHHHVKLASMQMNSTNSSDIEENATKTDETPWKFTGSLAVDCDSSVSTLKMKKQSM
jgi:hypothetical protein